MTTARPGTASAEPEAAEPRVQQGDLLIDNHSFEDGTTGWSALDATGRPDGAAADCSITGTEAWSTDGTDSLLLKGGGACQWPGASSSPVAVVAGEALTAFATIRATTRAAIGIRFTDDSGSTVGRRTSPRTTIDKDRSIEITATAPATATRAVVEIQALSSAAMDNVLITGPATALGTQISKRMGFLAMGDGVDQDGRAIVVTVGTGSEEDPAKIIATDVLTGTVTQVVDMPGAVGSWTVAQNPVSKIFYIGTYSSGALWSWKPGARTATRIGPPPLKAFGFAYGLSFGADGTVYGGGWGEGTDGYPGASIWKYVEGDGFGSIAPEPLTTDANYTRWTAYDEVTDAVFTGTGTKTHLYGCNASGDQACTEFTDLLSPELQQAAWLYTGKASNGYLTMWGGDSKSSGNDYLAILKVSRDAAGDLQAEKVTEIKGVIYAGPSDIVDGKVYFNVAGETDNPLHSYDLATGEEKTITSAAVNIFSRGWEAMQLADPAWPGTTLVGWNSGGWLVKWNIETGKLSRTLTEDIPETSIRVNNLSSGADGRIWTGGYLTGGLGAVAPMRSDQHATYPIGAQAEGMINYQGRIYQGSYPNGRIESFDPAADGDPKPRVDCTIGNNQNRPYGLSGYHDRVYFGSQAEYGHTQGAFGYLDLTTGTCTTIVGPLGEQSINAVTGSEGKVFGAGNIFYSYDGTPTEDQAKLLIFDEKTGNAKSVVWPIPDTRSINAAATGPDGTVWLYAEGWLVAMDASTEKIIMKKEIFPDLKPGDRISGNYGQLITNSDGRIYGNVGGRVFGFDPDPSDQGADLDLRVLFDGAGPHIANDDYGNLYVAYRSAQLLRLDPRS
ncbi:NHL repeat-containing protein [Microlunatus soli]|nr:hypothetical protein [Microlunatus soli]